VTILGIVPVVRLGGREFMFLRGFFSTSPSRAAS